METKYGDIVAGQKCPRCKNCDTVVYDGNYFCTNCEWIMGHQGRPKRIMIAYLVQRYKEAEVNGSEETMEIMANYLSRLV